MKVYVQIIDTKTGIYQTGMIDEPVKEEYQVLNALKHFGVDCVDWITHDIEFLDSIGKANIGTVNGTTKVVSVLCIE